MRKPNDSDTHRRNSFLPIVVFLSALIGVSFEAARGGDVDARHAPFLQFESGPTNSLLLTRDGTRLLVLNTTDDRVEVYRIAGTPLPGQPGMGGSISSSAGGVSSSGGVIGNSPALPSILAIESSIFTGLEPVAMVEHPTQDDIVFVANHVSDSVSVVDLALGNVIATIQVGDEPQGLAIAEGKLFVACARAPATPLAPGATLPGPIEENVVVVAQADPPYSLLKNVVLDGMKPRGVAVAGGTVYVAIQNSGNHTTLLDENHTKPLGLEQTVWDAFDGGPFPINPVLVKPELNAQNFARGWYVPNAGRIVFDFEYPNLVHSLSDQDVFALDAATGSRLPFLATGVGTTLYDIAVNPITQKLWITNTDARNRTRFEPRLEGSATTNRITLVDAINGTHQEVELTPPTLPANEALPTAITFGAGPTPLAFVAASGTASVLVFDAATAAFRKRIATGPIPSGLAFDSKRSLLFVHTRGDESIRAYDGKRFDAVLPIVRLPYDPEPPHARAGRIHLYDARSSSGHGNGSLACASCHVFGHGDGLAWDLGDPEGGLAYCFPDILKGLGSFENELVVAPTTPVQHPLKGPMVTQSLRGLIDPDTKDDLPLHWRGDRRTFHQFKNAFRALLGGSGVAEADMQSFARFLRSLRYAPNPYGPRDRVYTGTDAAGADKFGMNPSFSGKDYSAAVGVSCIDCHNGDFFGKHDFTGSRPVSSAGSFTQIFQTAQLRMAYEKHSPELTGFGLLHDGAVDGVRGFMDFTIPNGGGATFHNFTTQDKDEVAAFVEHWDHGLSPLVGAQFTLDPSNVAAATSFLDLAETQAKTPLSNVDLVLKGYRIAPDGAILDRGALYQWNPSQQKWGYQFDTGDFVDRNVVLLVVQAGIARFTFTCVPPGLGTRLGIDRDEDGAFDFVEHMAGLDPTRPDTDGDGYLDGFERGIGADPKHADAILPDSAPPTFESLRALEIGSDIATLEVVCDEPARLQVDVGTHAGSNDVASLAIEALRRRHDVVLDELPPGTKLFVTVTAKDRNDNATTSALSFTPLPPFVHIDSIALSKTGTGPFVVTAQVKVVDRNDQPVLGIPLAVFFAGDIGNQAWQRTGTTGSNGIATIALAPLAPSGSSEIAVSVAFVGSIDPASPWFVGKGGSIPKFFYDASVNRTNYARLTVP